MEYLEFERILSAKRMQRYKYTHIPNWLQKWNSVYGNICILFQTPCIGNRHQLYRQWIPENSDFILLDGNRFSFNVVWARSCAECLFQNQRLKIRRICILLPILNAKIRIRCLNIRYRIKFSSSPASKPNAALAKAVRSLSYLAFGAVHQAVRASGASARRQA